LFTALAVAIALILIDVFVSDGSKSVGDDEELEHLYEENSRLTRDLEALQDEKASLLSEVLDSRKNIGTVSSDTASRDAEIDELKEQILHLKNKLKASASAPVLTERAAHEPARDIKKTPSGQDYSAETYCAAVSQWAMDSVKPLRTVKKFAETCEDKEVAKDAELLGNAMEKILYFSSIDNIKTTPKNEKVVLNDILRDLLKKYSPVFNEKKIGIFRKGLENSIVTDKVWFVFGFSQLLGNALYSTGDFGKISIMAKEDEQNVYLSLEDSSMGIHDEEMKHIFEPGFVSEEARRISGNTTSTCLYLAKKAFDKIGVPLTVESVYGKGTKAQLRFEKPLEM
ncbi:MAG: hypothetical protein IJL87_09195, partial [Clostridia bacterium]|nr:hypothetical protein [Clostridia bacterium]